MRRLDVVLVVRRLAASRTRAQRLIEAGEVEIHSNGEWQRIVQPSHLVDGTGTQIRVNSQADLLKYVSRAGLKLEDALLRTGVSPRGRKCLDVGISTGGFSDCLLQLGAAQVVGIDVGHGQLAAKLQKEAKLQHFEGVNVRELPATVCAAIGGVTLCVVDVSFISSQRVIPVLGARLERGVDLLLLVKPQFEVGAENLNKKGIVRDETLFTEVLAQVLLALEKCGFSNQVHFPSALKGQDGNQEFFVHAKRN